MKKLLFIEDESKFIRDFLKKFLKVKVCATLGSKLRSFKKFGIYDDDLDLAHRFLQTCLCGKYDICYLVCKDDNVIMHVVKTLNELYRRLMNKIVIVKSSFITSSRKLTETTLLTFNLEPGIYYLSMENGKKLRILKVISRYVNPNEFKSMLTHCINEFIENNPWLRAHTLNWILDRRVGDIIATSKLIELLHSNFNVHVLEFELYELTKMKVYEIYQSIS